MLSHITRVTEKRVSQSPLSARFDTFFAKSEIDCEKNRETKFVESLRHLLQLVEDTLNDVNE